MSELYTFTLDGERGQDVYIVTGSGLDAIGRRLDIPRALGEPDAEYQRRLIVETKARQRGTPRTSE